MQRITRVFFVLATLATASLPAMAQEGLATGSTIQGKNTIRQAPSGGTTHGDPGLSLPDRSTQGDPTAEEKRMERENNAVTTICKGC